MQKTRNLLPWLFSLAVGALGTYQYHLTQFASRFNTFFGDRGDARGVVYLCEHWYQSLRGQAELLSPGMFYPVKGTLGYSECLVGYGVPYAILRACGVEMFSALEIIVILLTFLNYATCFILLYKVLRFRVPASCVGAAFFAFNSPKFFQTGHLQLQYVLFLPFIFIFIILFVQRAATLNQRNAFLLLTLAGIALNLQLLTAFYLAWFFAFWSALFLVLALCFRQSRQLIFALVGQFYPAIIGGAITFLIGLIPFLRVYLPVLRAVDWYSYLNVTEMIPQWWSLLSMSDGNYIWGWLSAAVRPVPPPATWGELTIGIGLVTSLIWVGLTFFGAWIVIKGAKPSSVIERRGASELISHQVSLFFLGLMILATTLFYVVGMKYGTQGYSPWEYVYTYFPGAKAIRAVSRYVIFLALPMAIAFAFMLHRGLERIDVQKNTKTKNVLAMAMFSLAVFGLIEQFGVFKVGGTGFSKKAERVYLNAMAAKLPNDCTVFYVAAKPDDKHNAFEYQYDAMLIAAISRIPTFNGSSSQFPNNWFGLYQIKDPAYEDNVKKWIALNNITGKVCRLELAPPVEAYDATTPNPINDTDFFVRQQYRDLFDREPSPAELNVWTEKLNNCSRNKETCDRINTSLNLYRSQEFYERAYFIYRFYEAALGRLPKYQEFTTDMRRMNGASPEDKDARKASFAEDFVNRAEFKVMYDELPPTMYLDKLAQTAGVALANRNELESDLISERKSRAQVLREVIESKEAQTKFSSRASVALCYFAYLRRDPDAAGFKQWVNYLDTNANMRQLMDGFVDSSEYRLRFFNSNASR